MRKRKLRQSGRKGNNVERENGGRKRVMFYSYIQNILRNVSAQRACLHSQVYGAPFSKQKLRSPPSKCRSSNLLFSSFQGGAFQSLDKILSHLEPRGTRDVKNCKFFQCIRSYSPLPLLPKKDMSDQKRKFSRKSYQNMFFSIDIDIWYD